jgi:hypothetical protein
MTRPLEVIRQELAAEVQRYGYIYHSGINRHARELAMELALARHRQQGEGFVEWIGRLVEGRV